MSSLRPFWRYYGGKWRVAPRYPRPRFDTIVEPFAGAAGYSLRYPEKRVILIEKYPVICEMWRYLIGAKPSEILRIPEVDDVNDLPAWVPQGARWLVGFSMNAAASTPRRTLSAGRRKLRAANRQFEGWTDALKIRIASQVDRIRHWQVIEGDYTLAPDIPATWFVDPPYVRGGKHYARWKINYQDLTAWCVSRQGQVMVCESKGADWAPFVPLLVGKAFGGKVSHEMLWEPTA